MEVQVIVNSLLQFFFKTYCHVNRIVLQFSGVGKSMTIRAVANHAEKILRQAGGVVNKPRVLLCAFTAKASNLISK